MATPGMVCSLPARPLGPSEGPPPWEHQGSCSPRPQAGREGKGGRGTDKGEGRAESQVRQLMGKKRCSGCYCPSSTPVFPYRLLPKLSPFPKGVMSVFLSQVNPFVFQVQLVSATTTVIFGAREHFPLHPALPQVF